ncbi:hypothetical protein ID866_11248 [Astraeus odoratus]|nr:hypothetical protein ID866_11248 [Astraeus odoratus]
MMSSTSMLISLHSCTTTISRPWTLSRMLVTGCQTSSGSSTSPMTQFYMHGLQRSEPIFYPARRSLRRSQCKCCTGRA